MAKRDPNLWFTSLSVRMEVVKKSMRKECCVCGERPPDVRLLVKRGAGRSQQTFVLCREHGIAFAFDLQAEAVRLTERLAGTDISVRLPDHERGVTLPNKTKK